MAQVALAWVLSSPVVSAPIVRVTRSHHLTEAVAALDLHLADGEIRAPDEPYTSHGPSWFWPARESLTANSLPVSPGMSQDRRPSLC